ncbi:hypothetical protein HX884_22950 [Enterobacter sp. SECR19-1250]|uniref:hypothetical protein n=1 Tax=Enterobacter sp. SECR19-1250 TaxID=2749084 RepID=UPI0015B55B30|nr:hypothetical protein [Enterobacter sp. SECR19-1250]NWJ82425.1 hypothetical protein [Enterobacter sp. SECR19-1250]
MPYYNGRWHLYDERERREYGERKRQERSRDWHKNWISRQGLKDRLWTDKAVAEFLPAPQKAGPIRAWKLENVLAIEQTPAFMAWMETRRVWLDARCRLPDIAYATYGLLAIGWDRRAPEKPIRWQKLLWNEARQDLTDYSRQWQDSPYTGADFEGHEPDEVACAIFEWFIRQNRDTPEKG